MSFDLVAIWNAVKSGNMETIASAFLTEVEKFFGALLGFLKDTLEIK